MCYPSPVMLRGRCVFAILERPRPSLFSSSSFSLPLTPLFLLHARHSPVSPIIPVHTQKQGGGECPLQNAFANNSLVFSCHVNCMLNSMSNYIVGAPTFLRYASPLSFFRIFSNSKVTTGNVKQPKSNHARTCAKTGVGNVMVTYLKYVGAPTFLRLRGDKPRNRSEDRPLHKKEKAGHDASYPYRNGGNPKTHPCPHQPRKDGSPCDFPISFFELCVSGDLARHSSLVYPERFVRRATAVICYAMWRSTPLPRARPTGSHPRKHRKFFMERYCQP